MKEDEAVQRELRDERSANETLRRISRALTAELELDRLVQLLTDEATALCGAQFGAFFYNVNDDKGGRYTLYTISGVAREEFSKFPMPRNTAVFAPTFDAEKGTGVVRSDDITKDPRYGHNAPHHGMPKGHLPVCSYLAASVVSRSGDVIGGLFFGHKEPARFTRLPRTPDRGRRRAGEHRLRQRHALRRGAPRAHHRRDHPAALPLPRRSLRRARRVARLRGDAAARGRARRAAHGRLVHGHVVDEQGKARRLAVVHADPGNATSAPSTSASSARRTPRRRHWSTSSARDGPRSAPRSATKISSQPRRRSDHLRAHARARLHLLRDRAGDGARPVPRRPLVQLRATAAPLTTARRRVRRGAGPPRRAGDRERAALSRRAAARGDDRLPRRGQHAARQLARPRLHLRALATWWSPRSPTGAASSWPKRGGAPRGRHRARRQRKVAVAREMQPALSPRSRVDAGPPEVIRSGRPRCSRIITAADAAASPDNRSSSRCSRSSACARRSPSRWSRAAARSAPLAHLGRVRPPLWRRGLVLMGSSAAGPASPSRTRASTTRRAGGEAARRVPLHRQHELKTPLTSLQPPGQQPRWPARTRQGRSPLGQFLVPARQAVARSIAWRCSSAPCSTSAAPPPAPAARPLRGAAGGARAPAVPRFDADARSAPLDDDAVARREHRRALGPPAPRRDRHQPRLQRDQVRRRPPGHRHHAPRRRSRRDRGARRGIGISPADQPRIFDRFARAVCRQLRRLRPRSLDRELFVEAMTAASP